MNSGWRIGVVLLLLLASGCDWTGRQADALGEHMPVIGDRCEHWQCITSSGQAQSDAIKKEQQTQQPIAPTASSDSTLYNVTPAVTEHQVTAPLQ